MKISVLLPRFAITGVPLAQLRFARALARRGHEVSLIVGYVDPSCSLPEVEEVKIMDWGLPKVRSMFMPLVKHFREDRPEVVFSAEDHLNTIVLLAALLSRSQARISCSSRVTPFDTYSSVPFTKRWILKWMARAVMPRANVLTCVSQDMVKQYQQVFKNAPHVCVYNSVVDAHSQTRMKEPVSHPWLDDRRIPVLVAAGRLAPWKGFASLIDAMALLVKKREARLLILGDGPLRDKLQTRIDAQGLTASVQLLGYVENPLKYFMRAKVFVLSSLVEGMPNVLVEAMMCGCTPVATDCPTGPSELLHGGQYGYLVPVQDPQAMALALGRALDDPIEAKLLKEAISPFDERVVINRHFELLGIAQQSGWYE